MKTPALERTSAAKSGWLIIVLTVGWMVFVLWPDPASEPAAKPAAMPLPATSLTRAGLPEYADWEGLPEFFALWADQAEWKDGRTRFAYWNPVMKDYSYEFEATRTTGGYRFREVNEIDALVMGEVLAEGCPIRFLYQGRPSNDPVAPREPPTLEAAKRIEKIEVNISRPTLKIETKIPAPAPKS